MVTLIGLFRGYGEYHNGLDILTGPILTHTAHLKKININQLNINQNLNYRTQTIEMLKLYLTSAGAEFLQVKHIFKFFML